MYGVRDFAAIINTAERRDPGRGGCGKARGPSEGEQIVGADDDGADLSVDHRAVDGATAAEFLRTLKDCWKSRG